MVTLAEALDAARPLDQGFEADVPDAWLQGRTAYGGFSSALALAAAKQLGGAELPPLRSVQISFVGPLSGTVQTTARQLRKGRNATWIGAEVTGAAGLGLVAQFVFMGSVASALQLEAVPVPDNLIALERAVPIPSGSGPAYLGPNFECRFATPRYDPPRPEICWWLRLRDGAELDPTVGLILCGDAIPPGVMPLMERRVPLSSLTWQVNLLTPAPATDDGWWLLRTRGDYAAAGNSSQTMELWNSRGQAMAMGTQSVALFG